MAACIRFSRVKIEKIDVRFGLQVEAAVIPVSRIDELRSKMMNDPGQMKEVSTTEIIKVNGERLYAMEDLVEMQRRLEHA